MFDRFRLDTRMDFADEADANAKDTALKLIELETRRKTLVRAGETHDGKMVFDIAPQGENRTVFFDA